MEFKTTLLVDNFNETIARIRENRSINEEINRIRSESNNKINSEKERILALSSNIMKEYDQKIDNIREDFTNVIRSKTSENNDLTNKINELKAKSILDRTQSIDKEINDLNLEYNRLTDKYTKHINLKNNTFLKYTVLQQNFIQWILLPVIIICIFDLSIGLFELRNNGVMQWAILIAEIGGVVWFKKWYKNELASIDSRLQKINSLKEDLIIKKNAIQEEISNGSSMDKSVIVSLVEKKNNNVLEINKLNEEMSRLINQCELEKKLKLNELDEISKEELERITLLQKEECDEKIASLKVKYSSNMELLEDKCEVTEEYQKEEILLKLISYLRNERAANKKEALDLFEKENAEEIERNARIKIQREQMQIKKQKDEKEMKLKEAEKKIQEAEFKLKKERQAKEFDLQRREIEKDKDIQIKQIESSQKIEIEKLEAEKLKEKLKLEKEEKEQLAKKRKEDKEYRLKEKAIDEKNKIDRDKLEFNKKIQQEKLEREKLLYNLDIKEKNQRLKIIENDIENLEKAHEKGACTKSEYESKSRILKRKMRDELERVLKKK